MSKATSADVAATPVLPTKDPLYSYRTASTG